MRRNMVVAVGVVTLVAAACAGEPAAGQGDVPTAVPAETLLLGTAGGPVAVRAPSGAVVSAFPDAVAGADGSLVYAASWGDGSTTIESRDGATGAVAATSELEGELQLRIVSGSGRAAALMHPLPPGLDPWTPVPRSRTTIVVADPTGSTEPRRYVLEGNYEPEAFSTDDGTLYLIQHLPALAPTAYRVTSLDLDRGRILPVFGPLKTPSERMPGTRLEQLASPDGDRLYTLYSSARPGYAPHDAPVESTAIVSFVHVLDLENGWAHCVGLPRELWDRPSSAQAMATSPDGAYLFVVDAGLGEIAAMHTETLGVRTADVDLAVAGPIDRTSAVMSADGETLFVATSGEGSTVAAVDVGTFDVVDRWRVDGDVSGLGLSSDGTRLYAAVAGRMVVLDAATGEELGGVPLATPEAVTRVVPLAG